MYIGNADKANVFLRGLHVWYRMNRPKYSVHDPEELRKMEEGKALLKELLGHTPTEVLAGAVLGVAIAMLMPVF